MIKGVVKDFYFNSPSSKQWGRMVIFMTLMRQEYLLIKVECSERPEQLISPTIGEVWKNCSDRPFNPTISRQGNMASLYRLSKMSLIFSLLLQEFACVIALNGTFGLVLM